MTISQGLESQIIGVGDNFIILTDVEGIVDITFTVRGCVTETFNFCPIAFNGELCVNLNEITKLVSANKKDYADPFRYEQDEIYNETDPYHFVKLDIRFENDGEVINYPEVSVVFGALQIGECINFGNLLDGVIDPLGAKTTINDNNPADTFPLTFPIRLSGLTGGGTTTTFKSPLKDYTISYVPTLPIFEGYPHSTTILRSDGVERILDYHPINMPVPDLQYVPEFIENPCNGIYVKWLGRYGQYLYWLFDGKYTEQINTRSQGSIQSNWKNRALAQSNVINIGQESRSRLNVFTKTSRVYMQLIASIVSSPEVYIYENDCLSVCKDTWTRVIQRNGNYTVRDSSQLFQELSLSFDTPELNTQTLV